MTEAEIYNAGMPGGTQDFAFCVDALARLAPGGWCLVDTLAVNAYADTLFTPDLDVTLADPATLAPVLDVLRGRGWRVWDSHLTTNARRPSNPGSGGSRLEARFTRAARFAPYPARATLRKLLDIFLVPVATPADVATGLLWCMGLPGRREWRRSLDRMNLLRLALACPEEVNPLLPTELRVAVQAERAMTPPPGPDTPTWRATRMEEERERMELLALPSAVAQAQADVLCGKFWKPNLEQLQRFSL